MGARFRPLLLVLGSLSLAAPLAIARAGDLATEPTTKGEPTTKSTDLSTGGTTLTPTPTVPPVKTGGTGGVAKPQPTPTPTPSAEPSESASASASASDSAEPPPTPPPSKPAAKSFSRRKVPLGVGDLEVSISMPESWAELPEASLPEVENTDQVTVATRKGFGVHDPKGKPAVVEEVIVACGKANGDYWADAIRDAAFTQMTAAVEKEAAKYTTVKSIEPDAIREDGNKILQSFATDAEYSVDGKTAPTQLGKGKPKAANTVKLQGLNFIAFHSEGEGKTPNIVACSVACAHLVAESDESVCAAAIGSIEISGTFAPAPKRSFLAELLFKLKKDPTTLWLGIVGAVFLLVVAALVIILAVRKKKPAEHAHDDHDDDEYADGFKAGMAAASAVAEIKAMHASPPPAEGFFDPQTLARRKI
jgi:hypothetical protein